MPQQTEIFLATQPSRLDTPDSTANEPPRVASSVDVFSPTAQIPEESSQLVIDELQPPNVSEIVEPGQSVVAPPQQLPLNRFFESAVQQQSPLDTQRAEMEEQVATQPSQLPFSLKAVIQFVDDQLRREKKIRKNEPIPEKSYDPRSNL